MKILYGTIVDWGFHLDTNRWEKTSSETTPFITPLDFMIICVDDPQNDRGLWKAKGVAKDHPLFGEVFTVEEIK